MGRQGQGSQREIRRKSWVPGDEYPFNFWAFSGHFAFRRNGLAALTLFICGSAGPFQNPNH
jgi:hypothetical protein